MGVKTRRPSPPSLPSPASGEGTLTYPIQPTTGEDFMEPTSGYPYENR
jgi:hypothetical protein